MISKKALRTFPWFIPAGCNPYFYIFILINYAKKKRNFKKIQNRSLRSNFGVLQHPDGCLHVLQYLIRRIPLLAQFQTDLLASGIPCSKADDPHAPRPIAIPGAWTYVDSMNSITSPSKDSTSHLQNQNLIIDFVFSHHLSFLFREISNCSSSQSI
jgi:hypothetical protein